MGWFVVTNEGSSREGRSSAMASQEAAVSSACDLLRNGVDVKRIEGPKVEFTSKEVALLCDKYLGRASGGELLK